MRTLELRTAVGEIAQACENARRWRSPSPFFFVVGAGISHPPLPLAGKIQNECRTEALLYGRTAEPERVTRLDEYSHWFAHAYPHPVDRQRYLREMMENAYISRANFRLAHLMLDQSVTNIAVTTNFDDLLSRALTLFGRRHILCDHPRTLERIDLQSPDVQIIHVHGTYWFYDCCNLRHEIEERSRMAPDTTFTMATLLDSILLTRSPLVVGYSGWEGDVIMNALRRRLSAGLRSNLYWFCYRSDEAAALPDWVRAHPNVCVVTHDSLTASGSVSEGGNIADLGITRTFSLTEAVLPATVVFDAFIRHFRLEPPKLTVDPLGFLSDQLQQFLSDLPAEPESDIYAIRGVVEQLKRAKQRLEGTAPEASELVIERLRDWIRRSDYKMAVREASTITTTRLTDAHLREVVSAMITAGNMLNDDSDEEVISCDLVANFADRLTHRSGGVSSLDEEIAAALLKKGLTLWRLKRFGEAVTEFDSVARRFRSSANPSLRTAATIALVNKGATLEALGLHDEALSAYDTVIFRYPQICEYAPEFYARALFNKGVILAGLGRISEEIAAYDELLGRFRASEDHPLRERTLKALFNKAEALTCLGHEPEALGVYDEIKVYASLKEGSPFVTWAAEAILLKGALLAKSQQWEDEMAAYEELAARLALETGVEQVVKASINKAVCLDALKRSQEQWEFCRDVANQCETLASERRDLLLARTLILLARACCRLNRSDERDAACDEVIALCSASSDRELQECADAALLLREDCEKGLLIPVRRFDGTALFRQSPPMASAD